MSRARTLRPLLLVAFLTACSAPAGSEAGVSIGGEPAPALDQAPLPTPEGSAAPSTDDAPEVLAFTMTSTSYAHGDRVIVTVRGMRGGYDEALVLAPLGSAAGVQADLLPTMGRKSGTYAFVSVPPLAAWVVRAVANDGVTILGESAPFEVRQPLHLGTDKASYAPNDSIVVSFGGLVGSAYDAIAIARPGASHDDVLVTASTSGDKQGVVELSLAGLRGRFVARAYVADAGAIVAESDPFVVSRGTRVAAAKTSYRAGEAVAIAYHGMAGAPTDWIGIAPLGSDPSEVRASSSTAGDVNGSVTFASLASGTFVARAFYVGSHDVEAESVPFDVGLEE